MPPLTPTPDTDPPRTLLAHVAIGLYVAVAVALAALIVLTVQTGRDEGGVLWFLLPPLAYVAGLACGAWQLDVLPEQEWAPRWIFGLMTVHGLAGLGGAAALAVLTLHPGGADLQAFLGWMDFALPLLVVAMGGMVLAALLALLLPARARRSETFVVAAFAGGGWLVAMLLLFL